MKSEQQTQSSEQGFTRSDLLIAVAMTLLLIAVQLPSLGNTKSASKATICASNLQRLIQAWTMYADDNSGRLVPNNGNINLDGGQQTWVNGWLNFSTSFDNINTDLLVDLRNAGRYGLLGPYLQSDASVFRCPADESRVTIFGRLLPRVRSVSMNNWMAGNAWAGQPQYQVFKKLEQISRPAPEKALVVLEEREDSINDSVFQISQESHILVDYPATYHDGGNNLTFADGHVDYHAWRDPRTVGFPTLSLPPNLPAPNEDAELLQSIATAPK